MRSLLPAAAALLLLGASNVVDAHGRLTDPPARNLGCQQAGTCGSVNGLVAGGPGTVHNGNPAGYTHGMCGNTPTEAQTWNQPGAITRTYTEGQSATFEVVITAHHIGFFEFELCDSPDISEQCFKANRLNRAGCSGDEACRKWWKPLLEGERGQYAASGYPSSAPVLPGSGNTVAYKFVMQFDLPQGLTCSHCVLRWHYLTTNSCTSASSKPEEFWNCADIAIEAQAGGVTRNTDASVDLLNTMPVNLRPNQDTAVDFWNCPTQNVPASGTGVDGEYSCDLNGVAGQACLNCNDVDCGSINDNGYDGYATPYPTTGNNPTPQPTIGSSPSTQPSSPTSQPPSSCGTCSGCLWVQWNACYTTWDQTTCERYTDDGYAWCGAGSGGGSSPTTQPPSPTPQPASPTPQPASPTPQPASPTPQPTSPTTQPTSPTTQPPSPTSQPPSSCGTCSGCLWVQWNACYTTWDQTTCELYTNDGYAWCGAGSGGGSSPTNQPPSPTPQPTTAQTSPTQQPTTYTGQECVTQAQLMAINGESTYWPGCDPSQPTKGAASGYIFGYYCTQEWTNELNKVLVELGYCDQPEVIRKFLAQAAYETGYYSTLGQPLDDGSGVIHMIPQNFQPNAQDMDTVFPGQGLLAAYNNAADKQQFFKEPQYAWKSAAAWFKSTNRVIPGCGYDLFPLSLDEQTACILGRVVSRNEALTLVSKHIPV